MSFRHAKLNRRRWARVRLAVFHRAGFRCEKCNRAGRLECDHRIPLERGGDPWALTNLQALCRGCHIEKSRSERPVRIPSPAVAAWNALVEERFHR